MIIWVLKWEKNQGLIQVLSDFIDVSGLHVKIQDCKCCQCIILFKNKNVPHFRYFMDGWFWYRGRNYVRSNKCQVLLWVLCGQASGHPKPVCWIKTPSFLVQTFLFLYFFFKILDVVISTKCLLSVVAWQLQLQVLLYMLWAAWKYTGEEIVWLLPTGTSMITGQIFDKVTLLITASIIFCYNEGSGNKRTRGSTPHITAVKWNLRWKAKPHLILGHRIAYFFIVFDHLLERLHFCVVTPSHLLRKTKHLARWVQARGWNCGLGKNGLDIGKYKEVAPAVLRPCACASLASVHDLQRNSLLPALVLCSGVMRGCRYFLLITTTRSGAEWGPSQKAIAELALGYCNGSDGYFALTSELEHHSWKLEGDCGQRETEANWDVWPGGYRLAAVYAHPSVGHG